jgi:Family of unknown function (DUF6334)
MPILQIFYLLAIRSNQSTELRQMDDFNSDILFQEDFIGYLSKVKYILDEDLGDSPIAFLMYFDRIVAMIRVIADDDSVELKAIDFDLANKLNAIDVSDNALWKDALGSQLHWVWSLTNNQGYTDGIQFEWTNHSLKKSIVIQAIAIASCFRLYKVEQFYC